MKQKHQIFSITSLVFLFSFLGLISCGGGGGYQPNPEPIDPNIYDGHPLDNGIAPKNFSYPSDAYDITKELPHGYKKDGSVDYTEYIQNGLEKRGKIVFPDFPILINKGGLKVFSETEIYFRENSKLIMEPNSVGLYWIISLVQAKNVVLNNIFLKGDRYQHLGTDGQWGMGIYMAGCEDVKINHGTFEDFWGDGIYLGEETWTTTNKHISIKNCHIKNSRRAGISIISGEHVNIDHCIIEKSNGPSISSGIILEPNKTKNELDQITIMNCLTKENEKVGISIVTSSLYNNEGIQKNSRIKIINHKDIASQYGLSFVLNKKNYSSGILDGTIEVSNLIFMDNSGHAIVDYTSQSNKVVLYDCYFKNINIISQGNRDSKEEKYFNDLMESRAYFHWAK